MIDQAVLYYSFQRRPLKFKAPLEFKLNNKQEGAIMKERATGFLTVAAMALFVAFTPLNGMAEQNSNSAKDEMKSTGSETTKAGKSMARNVKHGRVVHGGKSFGKHMGSAGKHFGKGTKKAVKKVIS